MRDAIEIHSQSPDPDTNDGGDKGDYYNAENGLTNRVNQLSAHHTELQNAIDGIYDRFAIMNDRFQSFDSRLDNIMNAITEVNQTRVEHRREFTSTNAYGTIPPAQILEHFLS